MQHIPAGRPRAPERSRCTCNADPGRRRDPTPGWRRRALRPVSSLAPSPAHSGGPPRTTLRRVPEGSQRDDAPDRPRRAGALPSSSGPGLVPGQVRELGSPPGRQPSLAEVPARARRASRSGDEDPVAPPARKNAAATGRLHCLTTARAGLPRTPTSETLQPSWTHLCCNVLGALTAVTVTCESKRHIPWKESRLLPQDQNRKPACYL